MSAGVVERVVVVDLQEQAEDTYRLTLEVCVCGGGGGSVHVHGREGGWGGGGLYMCMVGKGKGGGGEGGRTCRSWSRTHTVSRLR